MEDLSALKPVIVLIPGAWHSPDAWNKVKPRLEAAGYEVYAPRKLTVVGPEPVSYSWRADVAVVHDLVIPLFNQGRRVVIVGHSYGGIVATASIEGQSIANRRSRGLQGGFCAVVYICGFPIVRRGGSLLTEFNVVSSDWMIAPQPFDRNTPSSIKVIPGHEPFYNDLPLEQAREWSGKLLNQSQRSFEEPVEFSANDIQIPMTYLLCEGDMAIPIQSQEHMVAAIPAMKVRRCTAGHSPFLSQPDFTAGVIIEAAHDAH